LANTLWLNGPPVPRIFGDYDRLRRDYVAEEFVPSVQACGVAKSGRMPARDIPDPKLFEGTSTNGRTAHALSGRIKPESAKLPKVVFDGDIKLN
jgi:hypothetical protein